MSKEELKTITLEFTFPDHSKMSVEELEERIEKLMLVLVKSKTADELIPLNVEQKYLMIEINSRQPKRQNFKEKLKELVEAEKNTKTPT